MNTERNQVQDMLKNAAQQKPETVQQQPSQPKSTNKKSRNQTTQNAQTSAKQIVDSASELDSSIEMLALKNAAMGGLSLGQKEAAVFIASKEQTFKASVNAYLVGTANNNNNNASDVNAKEVLKLIGVDVDQFNEDLGKQVRMLEQGLVLPSTQPYLMLSSAD